MGYHDLKKDTAQNDQLFPIEAMKIVSVQTYPKYYSKCNKMQYKYCGIQNERFT